MHRLVWLVIVSVLVPSFAGCSHAPTVLDGSPPGIDVLRFSKFWVLEGRLRITGTPEGDASVHWSSEFTSADWGVTRGSVLVGGEQARAFW